MKKKKHLEPGWEAPNMTALMDILSNIIFFLMASFGAQTLEAVGASGVSLPASTSELSVRETVSVAVSLDAFFVEDERVEDLQKLEQILARVRVQRLAKNELEKEEHDVVLLVADKRLEYTKLDSVLKSCARAGFPRFRFVVAKT